jgi:ribonuclease P protein component
MQTFKKSERLNNKIAIDNLFAKAQSIVVSPFRLLWIEHKNKKDDLTQTLISVPKRNIKLASNRNVLKRRINEAFRLNKTRLCTALEERNKHIHIAVIYQKEEIKSYKLIEEKINLLLSRLIKEL